MTRLLFALLLLASPAAADELPAWAQPASQGAVHLDADLAIADADIVVAQAAKKTGRLTVRVGHHPDSAAATDAEV